MYLISIYFDEQTNKYLNTLINKVAEGTGNHFMLDNNVPPHITITAVDTKNEQEVLNALDKCVCGIKSERLHWVCVGSFVPDVLFIQPVLNEYLHNISTQICDYMAIIPETIIRAYYKPFSWLPHCTIGKHLTKKQMEIAYEIMQNRFVPFKGSVTKIGLAKTNPHRDIKIWDIE